MAHLRLARPDDAAEIQGIYAPVVEETVSSFEEVAPSAAEMRRRIERTLERLPWLVCEHGGAVVGYTSAHAHRQRAAYRWAVDTSVYVAESDRGHGVGRGLYEALFGILRAQGYVHAYAGTTLPNPASEGLHEAVGFEAVGTYPQIGYKDGTWHDVRWWHRPLGELPETPDEPVSIDEVVGTEAFDEALAVSEPTIGD